MSRLLPARERLVSRSSAFQARSVAAIGYEAARHLKPRDEAPANRAIPPTEIGRRGCGVGERDSTPEVTRARFGVAGDLMRAPAPLRCAQPPGMHRFQSTVVDGAAVRRRRRDRDGVRARAGPAHASSWASSGIPKPLTTRCRELHERPTTTPPYGYSGCRSPRSKIPRADDAL